MLSFEQIRDELRESAAHLTEYELCMIAATASFYAEAGKRAGWQLGRAGRSTVAWQAHPAKNKGQATVQSEE